MDCFVVTCEHGGNAIPAEYGPYFAGLQDLLGTHRGHDPGALPFAQELSSALRAPLVASTTSRLLVDLNRSVGHRRLFHESIARAPRALRTEIVAKYHRPYRERVERLVADAIARGHRVVHVSSHSFTPVLDGRTRDADVGMLYDPSRPPELERCLRWRSALLDLSPGLRVRRNYPYRGSGDGLTSHLRKLHGAKSYLGIELEINQAIVSRPSAEWNTLRGALVASFQTSSRE